MAQSDETKIKLKHHRDKIYSLPPLVFAPLTLSRAFWDPSLKNSAALVFPSRAALATLIMALRTFCQLLLAAVAVLIRATIQSKFA